MKLAKMAMLVAGLVLIAAIGFNCAKESSPTSPGESTYLGTWRWVQSSGGYAGRTETPESVGFSRTLILAGSNVYQIYRDDLLLYNGLYYVSWEKRGWCADSCFVISYENNPEEQIIISHADTLELVDMCYDCYQHLYTRAR
ncbi:hypothetical protein ACFLQW_04305 [Candidatus Zixiibacteriota bacterium]